MLDVGPPLRHGPFNYGHEYVTATPVMCPDSGMVGYRIAVPDSADRYVFLNPSTGGDSADVFVYEGADFDPDGASPLVFVDVSS